MARPSRKAIARALLERHGRTFAADLGFTLRDAPSPLFRLLCASLLLSARMSSDVSLAAARNLAKQGWTTAEKLGRSTWRQRVKALNEAGYARYQERTATMLGEAAELLVERYDGDLRKLRRAADRDPRRERKLLKEVKGIGDVGVDIFFREAQAVWEELRPFADRRALAAAGRLGLGDDARALERVADGRLEELVAALVRVELADDYDDVLAAARG